jgi:putative FmdB family regulatory protein
LPLYEYECAKDGTFEKIQKFSDPPLTACPTCGGPVERLLSAPAIQFKGTGWYITDYARKGDSGGKKDAAKAGGGSESASGKDAPAASSSSSDSKAGSASSSGSEKK